MSVFPLRSVSVAIPVLDEDALLAFVLDLSPKFRQHLVELSLDDLVVER
jgi:hypothetical protein